MENYYCTTCGAQYPESIEPPELCKICSDERQFVNPQGQSWTTHKEILQEHRNKIEEEEPSLFGVGIEPSFAIGQRALLIKTEQGNLLWDCIPLITEDVIKKIKSLGGIDAIAISHPHYYTGMVEWSKAFGNIPIHLHQDDQIWVMRPDDQIKFWSGETLELFGGLTMIRCGGHFPGGCVLHWPEGAEGKGVLLTGDIIQVVPDRRFVSFMYSYPNLIPLAESSVRGIEKAVEPFEFDRIYGAWWDSCVPTDGSHAVKSSADRYVKAINLFQNQII